MAVPAGRMKPLHGPARRQRGLALVTAVLVVVMAAVAATAMVVDQQYSVYRTTNLLHGEQAEAYMTGAESWAKVLLRRDLEDSKIDTLEEDWAQPLVPVMVEGGMLQGHIEDLQGRFNLNNLAPAGTEGEGGKSPAQRQFENLLRLLELESDLAAALMDWLDTDIDTRFPGGAEDDIYLSREPPYRAANAYLNDVSELRLVDGFTEEVVKALAPHVTVLPQSTPVNINTATATVLASLAEEMTLSDGEQLVDDRTEAPFETIDQFKDHDALAGVEKQDMAITVSSEYFRVWGQVQVGRGQLNMVSLLSRTDKGVVVLGRSQVLPFTVP